MAPIPMLALLLGLIMAFDNSDYRQNTYGAPTHYCDCTRSLASNGTGTLGDPWNLNQAKANAVAGNVVGFIPVGAGTPVDMDAPNNANTPIFNPTNAGTAGNPIVFVTKYAAVKLYNDSPTTLATNTNRTELRHAGTADAADVTGTGGAMYGSNSKNYITYDGFFVDMAEANFTSDSGVITARACTGVKFLNFAIKGTVTDVDSNAEIYRGHGDTDTTLSNFVVYDYDNQPTGGGLNQQGFVVVMYGSQNYLIEHFLITNCDNGVFAKGTEPAGSGFNYGTIQYGIVYDGRSSYQFNDCHASSTTTLQYCLAYFCAQDGAGDGGIVMSSETTAARNLTIDHCTVAKVNASSINTSASIETRNNGIGSNVSITNCLIDNDNGTFGHEVELGTTLPATLNYNCYFKNGGTESYVFNGTQYNTFASWQAAISGRDANSQELSTSPFVDRTNDDYHVSNGHAAKTASSTGGEVGCYATSQTIGIDVAAAAAASGGSFVVVLR